MGERISADLIERIRQRLTVDYRRTGDGNWLRMPQEWRHRQAPAFPMSVMWKRINDAAAADEMAKELKPISPLDEKSVAKVEKSLGRKLPPQLRQLYLDIGDGGFGPFSGLRRLSNWAKDSSKLLVDTPKERGRDWSENLLPIVYMNGKCICVDAASGEVVLWSKPPKKASPSAPSSCDARNLNWPRIISITSRGMVPARFASISPMSAGFATRP